MITSKQLKNMHKRRHARLTSWDIAENSVLDQNFDQNSISDIKNGQKMNYRAKLYEYEGMHLNTSRSFLFSYLRCKPVYNYMTFTQLQKIEKLQLSIFKY